MRRLLQGEPQLAMSLRRDLRQLAGSPESVPVSTGQRTAGDLIKGAEEEERREKAEQARKAELKHKAELEALAQRGDAPWQDIDMLLEKYTAQNYDQAVQLVSNLREVARLTNTEPDFQVRLNGIFERYRTRAALLERLRIKGMHPA